jgi:hypothetical protein
LTTTQELTKTIDTSPIPEALVLPSNKAPCVDPVLESVREKETTERGTTSFAKGTLSLLTSPTLTALGEPTQEAPQDFEDIKEDKVYEVTSVIGHEARGDQDYFKIRWKGYQGNFDTWEPLSGLEDAKEAILAYKIRWNKAYPKNPFLLTTQEQQDAEVLENVLTKEPSGKRRRNRIQEARFLSVRRRVHFAPDEELTTTCSLGNLEFSN